MPDQIVDVIMARVLHADACRTRPPTGCVVMRDPPEHPDEFAARLLSATTSPYVLVADTLAEVQEVQQRLAELTADAIETTHPTDVEEYFANKIVHLQEMRERKAPIIAAEKASWRHPEVDVLGELKKRIEPLLEESIYLAQGVGGPVRLDLTDGYGPDGEVVDSIVVDFPAKQVREYADENVAFAIPRSRK